MCVWGEVCVCVCVRGGGVLCVWGWGECSECGVCVCVNAPTVLILHLSPPSSLLSQLSLS